MLEDLTDNWDDFKLSATDNDLVGCFLLLCEEVNECPSLRHFLLRPIKHPQMANQHILAELKGSDLYVKKNAEAQTNLNREGIIVTNKPLGVEAYPGKHEVSTDWKA